MQFTVTQNDLIAKNTYHMRLTGDTRQITRPGQFVQVALPGFYLRRPISVCDWHAGESGTLDLVYKTVGHGTEAMAALKPDAALDLLCGLGNGYNINDRMEVNQSQYPLLVGGGVGVPPLYALGKGLLAGLKKPRLVMGFGSDEVFYQREFQALDIPVDVTTIDGSAGQKGLVTDAITRLHGQFDYVYACGPEPMLRAVHALCQQYGIPGQYSFEERMACGFGVCMGCTCKTKYGAKRICKDGPVLFGEEIVW